MSSNEQQTPVTHEAEILITAKKRLDRLEQDRDAIAQTLAELAEDVRDLGVRVRNGEVEKPGEAGKMLADLRYWLKAARETEAEIENIARKDEGICEAWGLDLDAAAVAIGCRLNRIVECCREGELSD